MAHRTDGGSRQQAAASNGASADKGNAPLVSLDFNQLSHAPSPWVLNYRFHSKTQRVCWMGPLYILPAIGGLLYWGFGENAAVVTAVVWIGWFFFAPPLMGRAIRRWGERFWFFDFSRNSKPSSLERRIARIGLFVPVLLPLALVLGALVVDGFHDILSILGGSFAIAVVLAFFGSFIVPFLIIVFTGFKVRPVIDDGDGEEEVSVVLQGSS